MDNRGHHPDRDAGVHDRAYWRKRALDVLHEVAALQAGEQIPPGFWNISDDVWQDLNTTAAFDSMERQTVPLLHGRPMIRCGNGPTCCIDLMIFQARVGGRYA
jgi:hypothetical protein